MLPPLLPPSTRFSSPALHLHTSALPSPTTSALPSCHRYDFLVRIWNGLTFFELFKLLFSLGIDHDSHVLYVHMTYVSSFTRSHGQEKSLSYYDLLYDFRSSTLWTHPHPHSLPFPPQIHHPYTRHLCRSTTDPLGEEFHPVAKYGRLEGPGNT